MLVSAFHIYKIQDNKVSDKIKLALLLFEAHVNYFFQIRATNKKPCIQWKKNTYLLQSSFILLTRKNTHL